MCYLAARLYMGASVRFFALIKGEFVGNAAHNNYLYAFLVVWILPSRTLARILRSIIKREIHEKH